MKKALVTGYSSGIGKAICETLEKNGYEILKLQCRLQQSCNLEEEVKTLLKDHDLDVLVNCAGVGVFAPHEEISVAKIKELIDVNLTAPLILSNLCLRSLKKTKGHIINIASVEATRHSKFSALYTATKSGLRNFSLSLFEELRRADVKVTSINPDLTKTNFFDELQFEPSSKENTHLLAEDIAKAVLDVLQFNGVITELTVRPQRLEIIKK
ncbi:SDR family oxidoreductase [Candidatus Marinarcus aquaticus]|uniref:Short-chain dehydrogenase n=1 Tax=Candidatus Marinarcus aquaticus TaxID=2044504 RepID=A0A4Q0XSF2_9BACT|nr:SDR family NAD(P)-dependent oxidoreductase [Candidatus Marinarcus aquaticus]RXJ57666.1 short-chain dehydrogenase [Candidatus Marinarcus aquaticus]